MMEQTNLPDTTTWPLPERLRLARVTITLEAEDMLDLPPHKGNLLRGVFGSTLKRLVCAQRDAQACPPCRMGNGCPYGYLYEPRPAISDDRIRLDSDVPPPFVLEPPEDQRMLYRPGEALTLGLVLIGRGIHYLPYFLMVFEEIGRNGLGRRRARCRVRQVRAGAADAPQTILFDAEAPPPGVPIAPEIGPSELAARAAQLPTDALTIDFLSPTRLKHDQHYIQTPDFHVLVQALVRRVAALALVHCDQVWPVEVRRALVVAADRVTTRAVATRWVTRERFSARQGQGMSIGGFVGTAIFEGDLAPFRPLLVLGEMVHVGKVTTFGNGQYRCANAAATRTAVPGESG